MRIVARTPNFFLSYARCACCARSVPRRPHEKMSAHCSFLIWKPQNGRGNVVTSFLSAFGKTDTAGPHKPWLGFLIITEQDILGCCASSCQTSIMGQKMMTVMDFPGYAIWVPASNMHAVHTHCIVFPVAHSAPGRRRKGLNWVGACTCTMSSMDPCGALSQRPVWMPHNLPSPPPPCAITSLSDDRLHGQTLTRLHGQTATHCWLLRKGVALLACTHTIAFFSPVKPLCLVWPP